MLDELPEFGQRLIEVLRQPLEGQPRHVVISRASGSISYPANFMFIAAQNPCPCGYDGDPTHSCSCSERMVTRYRKRISGPLLDRIDLHVTVPRIDFNKLTAQRRGESSAAIRERIEAARARQTARLAWRDLVGNADMGPTEVREYCKLDETGRRLMKSAMQPNQPSGNIFLGGIALPGLTDTQSIIMRLCLATCCKRNCMCLSCDRISFHAIISSPNSTTD